MTKQDIDYFMINNNDCFPAESLPYIYEELERIPQDRANALKFLKFKNPVIALVLSIFLGELGVDRFYIGNVGMGIGKLLTGGGCGVWWFIDLFLIMNATRQKNLEDFRRYVSFNSL